MDTRLFPALGREIPVIGTGTWQLGIDLSEVDPSRAFSNLDAACASGVTFIDTADAYDNGASERFLGEFLSARPRTGLTVATERRRIPPTPSVETVFFTGTTAPGKISAPRPSTLSICMLLPSSYFNAGTCGSSSTSWSRLSGYAATE